MEIRAIQSKEVPDYCQLQFRAYPSMKFGSKADWEAYVERTKKSLDNKEFKMYGCFENKQLVGSLILYHYQINFLGEWVPIEGVGSVAVDLLHKREHICKYMMEWAEKTMLTSGAPMAFLFPFRPDFYVPMGYGYGPVQYHYEIDPSRIPHEGDKSKLIYLTKEDIPLLQEFENRLDPSFHGYIKKQDRELSDFFERISFQKIGFIQNKKLEGWMVFNTQQPDPKNFLRSHLYIYEWWNGTMEARMAFLAFFYSQKDQYEKIVYNTVDSTLMHVLSDPRSDTKKMIPPFISHPVGQISTSIFYSVLDYQNILQRIIAFKGKENVVPFDLEIRKPFPEPHIEPIPWSFDVKSAKKKPVLTASQSIASSLLTGSLSLVDAVRWNLAAVYPEKQVLELDDFLKLPIPYGTPNC